MTAWVIINNGNGKISVGKDGVFYDVDSTGLEITIHAVQWDGSIGEIEKKDAETDEITQNIDISDMTQFQFAIDAWQSAYDAEQAAIALSEAKADAYQSAYDQAIANGDSEEEAVAAGQAASNAVTSA